MDKEAHERDHEDHGQRESVQVEGKGGPEAGHVQPHPQRLRELAARRRRGP